MHDRQVDGSMVTSQGRITQLGSFLEVSQQYKWYSTGAFSRYPLLQPVCRDQQIVKDPINWVGRLSTRVASVSQTARTVRFVAATFGIRTDSVPYCLGKVPDDLPVCYG